MPISTTHIDQLIEQFINNAEAFDSPLHRVAVLALDFCLAKQL